MAQQSSTQYRQEQQERMGSTKFLKTAGWFACYPVALGHCIGRGGKFAGQWGTRIWYMVVGVPDGGEHQDKPELVGQVIEVDAFAGWMVGRIVVDAYGYEGIFDDGIPSPGQEPTDDMLADLDRILWCQDQKDAEGNWLSSVSPAERRSPILLIRTDTSESNGKTYCNPREYKGLPRGEDRALAINPIWRERVGEAQTGGVVQALSEEFEKMRKKSIDAFFKRGAESRTGGGSGSGSGGSSSGGGQQHQDDDVPF